MGTASRAISFTKMQGVGNDFVLVDARGISGVDWSGLAREICDRRFGVGADGLLAIDTTTRADAAMRMFNPDGTPDVCGNGLRCVARYLVERARGSGPHPDRPSTVRIATLTGVRRADVHAAPEAGPRLVTVEMGEPRFSPADIPMLACGSRVLDFPLEAAGRTLPVTVLSTGSAHAVAFVEALPDENTFREVSPAVEDHPVFPNRTSLMWTRVEGADRLRIRIWERGVGETLGCGTGACAAAVAARLHGFTGETVVVASKGGELVVRWSEGREIEMTGPAAYVFEGTYPLDPDGRAL